MKKGLMLIFGVALSFFLQCEKDGNGDDTSCTDGIKNGSEEFIDCGGECLPCQCDYEPCILLTNESRKTWRLVAATDTDSVFIEFSEEWTNLYRVDHTGSIGSREKYSVTWEFDNPESPTKIFFTYNNEDINESTHDIIVLTGDSLIMFTTGFGYDFYVPE